MTLRTLAAAALAMSLVACSHDVTLPQPPPTTGFLSGRTVVAVPGSDQSRALAGATVTVLNSNLHAVSDDQGNFVIGPLPKGKYSLYFSATANGALRQKLLSGLTLTPGATGPLGDVSLQQNAQLTGHALIQGRSGGNAGITVFSPGTDFVTATADSGSWLLANLPEGNFRVSAFRQGFTPATTNDIAAQGGIVTSTVDLILEPEPAVVVPGAIYGQVLVVDAAHPNNSGVTLRAWSLMSQKTVATAQSDAAGNFSLVGLAPDLYTLYADLDGLPSARIPNLAIGSGVEIHMADPIVLAGLSPTNIPYDGGIGESNVTPGVDAGPIVEPDGGVIGAECNIDNDCASGRLCIDHRCVGCSATTPCRAGYSCHGGDCVRDCTSNDQCPHGQACQGGQCGPCVTSADCKDPLLVCNASGACAHCRDRSECPAGKACLAAGCGECTDDIDCGAGSLCQQGVCVLGDCHSNAFCPSNQACIGRFCSSCQSDGECRTYQLCLSGACQAGNCRTVAECAPGQVCLGNLCGACATDADCGADHLCLLTASGLRCTPGTCRFESDCLGASLGLTCQGNQCLPCTNSSQCAAGEMCNNQGRCVVGDCLSAADCTGAKAGFSCKGSVCTPCASSADCGPGHVCAAGGVCKPGNCVLPGDCPLSGELCVNNQCSLCTASSQCGVGQLCNAQGLCVTGDCLSAADCQGSKAGWTCKANLCTPCSLSTDCAASGYVCASGVCKVGNCLTAAECPLAGQLCVNSTCTGCTTSANCPSGNVCDVDQLCHPGNCITTADCAAGFAGKVCLTRQCSNCQSDAQCGGGKICVSGSCVTGVCHSDVDCSGGQQLCDTNPASATAWTCKPCSPVNAASGTTCGTGRVCDLSGFCHVGTCVTNAQCFNAAAPVCVGFSCTSCTADSQCNGGQLCIGAKCVTGSCHGTGTDPNIDCAATKGVCVNNNCVGNCRGNADCAQTGYCDTSTHLCGPCTGAGQCGTGKVCASSAGGNLCLAGQCSTLEPNCATGYNCVANQCQLIAPVPPTVTSGYPEPGAIMSSTQSSMVLSGKNTLYFTGQETASMSGSYAVALNPDLTQRWRKLEGTQNNNRGGYVGSGLVLPAPGYPGGELFVSNDGNVGWAVARRSDTGDKVWSFQQGSRALAAGLVQGVPHIAWISGANANWMRADGTGQRSSPLNGCTWGADQIAFGTAGIYYVCTNGFYVVDPISGTVVSAPHNGNATFNGGAQVNQMAIWRPPSNSIVRGVNSGTVSSDLVIYGLRATGDWLLSMRVQDNWVATGFTPPAPGWAGNSGVGLTNVPLMIDSTGAVYVTGGNQLTKVSALDGTTLAKATGNGGSIVPLYYVNLLANDQLIGIPGLQPPTNVIGAYSFADGQTSMMTNVWTLPASPIGYMNLYPSVQATATSPGAILAFQYGGGGQLTTLQRLPNQSGAQSYLPTWPAWSLLGNQGGQLTAPSYDCTSDAQCTATQTCMFGRCAGNCRAGADCPAGQGCTLGTCGGCTSNAGCRAGESCFAGSCIACPAGKTCCSTAADCSPGNYCAAGGCAPLPAHGSTGSWNVPSQGLWTGPSHFSVGSDGTLYVGDTDAQVSGKAFWREYSPAGALMTTIPATAAPSISGPWATLVQLGAGGDTIFHGAWDTVYSAPGSTTVAAWNKSTYKIGTQAVRIYGLAQGVSSLTGSPKPTLFMSVSAGASNYVMAVDATAAANTPGANAGLLWYGVLASPAVCNLTYDNVMVGSDGTVYVVCTDSTIEAWAPDGDPATPMPSKTGLMNWRSASTSWGAWGNRPTIGAAPGGDVIYLPRSSASTVFGFSVLPVSYGPTGTKPIDIGTLDAVTGGVVTDTAGNAIIAGNRYVGAVSPTGTVLSNVANWWAGGHGYVLTAENLLLFIDQGLSTYSLTAVQMVNQKPVAAYALLGPGNLSLDNSSGIAVLSSAQAGLAGGGGMLIWDQPAAGSTGMPRMINGLPMAATAGASPSWSATLGDQQRRSSLKTK